MWKVTLQLFFKRTSIHPLTIEPNPTLKDIDAHMKKKKNYIEYVKDIFYYGDYGEMPKNIKYLGQGKISFILKEKTGNYGETLFKYKKDIINHIMNESFEDGLYGGGPGSHGVYPTKHKYEYGYDELGVIDCRKLSNIHVEKVQQKQSSIKK